MKKNFYPLNASMKRLINLSLAAMLMLCGVISQAQTYTITFPSPPPADLNDASLDHNDHFGPPFITEDAIEFGIKFKVTQPGTITAIRFYRGNAFGGTITGHLWSLDGTLRATGAFPVGTGWLEAPVSYHITPVDTFVASIYSDLGDYALEGTGNTWVSGTDYVNPPIIVITDNFNTGFAGNGLYIYIQKPSTPVAGQSFPNNNFGEPNYWVDIRFLPDFPLPVTLTDFRAVVANKDVNLSWKTASETNNKGFEIQRSSNGRDWSTINFVNGAGESSVTRTYNYSDKSLAPGLYYYRLNQVDNDGKSKTSPVVTANISGKGQVALFTPNPLHGSGLIRFDLPRAQRARVSVFDMSGREIKVLSDNSREAGSHVVRIDAASLRKQLYFVRLRTEDGSVTKAILID